LNSNPVIITVEDPSNIPSCHRIFEHGNYQLILIKGDSANILNEFTVSDNEPLGLEAESRFVQLSSMIQGLQHTSPINCKLSIGKIQELLQSAIKSARDFAGKKQ